MSIENILVVDDEPLIRELLEEILKKEGYSVNTVKNGLSALKKIKEHHFDLIITDVRMPDMDGIMLLKKIRESSFSIPVIVITAYGSIENAVEVMKKGADDYITKPITPAQLKLTVQKISKQRNLLQENRYLRREIEQKYGYKELIGKSQAMREVYRMIDRAALSKSTVLISGETGTGKELVARAIHHRSSRRDKPFISVNCAALPKDLLESELFGHEKGSFTGAISKREGRFELADKGTLLLDEISATRPAFQAKLLRVLQEEEFERVGGNKTIKVDVRIIATTNKNLKKMVEKGEFREDLYYRLDVIPIHLPPLRKRKEDIPLLVQFFLKKYNHKNGGEVKEISKECFKIMEECLWPGNVRELENVIERAVVMNKEKTILPQNFALDISCSNERINLPENITIKEMEKKLIKETLQKMKGNRTKTAKVLGVSVRTIRNKIKEYQLW